MKRSRGIPILLALALSTGASAQPADPLAPLPEAAQSAQIAAPVRPSFAVPAIAIGFEGYKPRLAYLARVAGVREATISAVIPYLRMNGTAVRLDRAQTGTN